MCKFKDGKYWMEINYHILNGKRSWFWLIKSCNGRIKCTSFTIYSKKSLAYNDAMAFANEVGLKVR